MRSFRGRPMTVDPRAKIRVSVWNGFAFLNTINRDPLNKPEDLIPQAKEYKQKHVYYHKTIFLDRIYSTQRIELLRQEKDPPL